MSQFWADYCDTVHKQLSEKNARIAALEGALAYYAEIRNYSRAGGDPPDAEPFILSDRGARARAALAVTP